MKSNGWSPDMAALQLFAHLDAGQNKRTLERLRE